MHGKITHAAQQTQEKQWQFGSHIGLESN